MLQMAVRKKYKGNTLPEVLIALSIVSFCSTLAVLIYLNIQKSAMPFIKIKAGEAAAKCLGEVLASHIYVDEIIQEDIFTIKKTASRNAKFFDCIDINITVFNKDRKQLVQLQSIVHEK